MPQGAPWDTCPIKTLLKVVEGLLAVKLLFRYHFHINATDKVGIGHSMWRRVVYPSGSFIPPSLFQLWSSLFSLGLHEMLSALFLFPSLGRRSPWSLLTSSGQIMQAILRLNPLRSSDPPHTYNKKKMKKY